MAVVYSEMHTCEQFVKLSIGFGSGLVSVSLLGFSILRVCSFWHRLFCSGVVCFSCIRFSFIRTSQEIG